MMTDPIADMLTRLRNATNVHKREVGLPFSKMKMAMLEILEKNGYVEKVEATNDAKREILVTLKYNGKSPVIQDLKRISKPGHRKYIKAEDIKPVLNGFGIAILSTPKGILTDKEARIAKVGGELLCEVY